MQCRRSMTAASHSALGTRVTGRCEIVAWRFFRNVVSSLVPKPCIHSFAACFPEGTETAVAASSSALIPS